MRRSPSRRRSTAGENYTAIAMDGGEAGVQVIVATEAAEIPNTAMSAGGATLPWLVGVGVALLGVAIVATPYTRRATASRAR